MSRLCSTKEIPNLLLTTYFKLLLKYLLNGYDAISPSLCKILLRQKIGYDSKITYSTLEINDILSDQDPITKSWAVTLLFLGMGCVFSWALAMAAFFMYQFCNVTDHLLTEMFDTQPCDSVHGKYCKVNNQHYPEVWLEHQGVPRENPKLLFSWSEPAKWDDKVDHSHRSQLLPQSYPCSPCSEHLWMLDLYQEGKLWSAGRSEQNPQNISNPSI